MPRRPKPRMSKEQRDDFKPMISTFINDCNKWDEADVLDLLDVCEARLKPLRRKCERAIARKLRARMREASNVSNN